MSQLPTITLSNKLIVPERYVSEQELRNWHYEWEETIIEPEVDEDDNVVLDDFGQPVTTKRVEQRTLRTYKERFLSGGECVYMFPRGNAEKIQHFLKNPHRDLRPLTPLGFPLQMSQRTTSDHRWPDQERCVNEWLKRGGGIILGDTGSGKTVMGVGAICRLGLTTLIMSGQTDGIDQWIGEIRRHTNINTVAPTAVGAYSPKRWQPITVATVQSFLYDKGKEWLYNHRSSFGLVLLDEVHDFGSPEFSKVAQALNPVCLLGLTATIERKDQRHHLIYDTVGPIVARGTAKQMPPTVYFIATGVKAPGWIYQKAFPNHYQWNMVLKHLGESEERYEIIRKYLHEDLDAGRRIACIAQRTVFVKILYQMMQRDGYKVAYVDGSTPNAVRKRIYEDVNNGKVQALFAGKVLNQLVNLPAIDCLHFVTPSSSDKVTKQTYGRARRWLEGKRNPVIRDYVDSGGQLDGAYKNRARLCKANGWDVKRIDVANTQMLGTSIWKPHVRKKK